MFLAHRSLLRKVFCFPLPCLCPPHSQPRDGCVLAHFQAAYQNLVPTTYSLPPQHAHTHTHIHSTHIHSNREGADPRFSGHGPLHKAEIEGCETDANPPSAFPPNIRTRCPSLHFRSVSLALFVSLCRFGTMTRGVCGGGEWAHYRNSGGSTFCYSSQTTFHSNSGPRAILGALSLKQE